MASLAQRHMAGAIYAPAIQAGFSSGILRSGYRDRLYGGTGIKVSDLNFLNSGGIFDINVYLTSAHVYRNIGSPDITHSRRPGQVHIVDSGGYSLINADIKADAGFARRMWEYQVRHADIALTLDIPLRTVSAGVNSHYRSFDDCLKETCALLRLYSSWNNSPCGAGSRARGIRWLNILQGENVHESRVWYQCVRYSGFDGWAFGGTARKKLSIVIARLFDMKEDGFIRSDGWFHFLGVGGLNAFVALTAIRDGLRSVMGSPHIQVSFDSAYPFNSVSRHRRFYKMDDWRPDEFGFLLDDIPTGMWALRNDNFTGIKGPMLPFLSWEDLAYDMRYHKSGRVELGGQKNDFLFQHHNVWCHVTAFADVYDQLLLPRKERTLPALYSDRYELIRSVVESGSRGHLANQSSLLDAVPM